MLMSTVAECPFNTLSQQQSRSEGPSPVRTAEYESSIQTKKGLLTIAGDDQHGQVSLQKAREPMIGRQLPFRNPDLSINSNFFIWSSQFYSHSICLFARGVIARATLRIAIQENWGGPHGPQS